MTKEDLYGDYLLIKQMKSHDKKKIRMLTEMMAAHEHHWRVVGVTHNALKVFAENNFKKTSRIGINRSHLVDRSKTLQSYLNQHWEMKDWWDDFWEKDKTILATSTENKQNSFSTQYMIDYTSGLFKTQGFAWKHGRAEENFLRKLATEYFNQI